MNDSKIIAPNSIFKFKIQDQDLNKRLDIFISKQFSSYSRSFFKNLIEKNLISINGKICNKPGYLLRLNDEIIVKFPPEPEKIDIKNYIENSAIELIFEHPDFLVVYKPAGVLTHKATTNSSQFTLVDWILNKYKEISKVGLPERAGIVHRLDMNTSGLIIVARNNYAHTKLSDMFKNRQIKKTYMAIVEGSPEKSGVINFPITRHPSGSKMTAIKSNSHQARGKAREALTNYKVIKYFDGHSLVEANPVTGRTHQIRVHLSSIGHPIIGDIIYGKKSKLINRQALHAYKLEFDYEGKHYNFKKEIPEDFNKAISLISLNTSSNL